MLYILCTWTSILNLIAITRIIDLDLRMRSLNQSESQFEFEI